MRALNAKAVRDFRCTCCRRRTVKTGERFCVHGDQLWCAVCVEKLNARLGMWRWL